MLLFSWSVVSDSLRPHGLQPSRLPCHSPSPGVCSYSCPLSRWCHLIVKVTLNMSLYQYLAALHADNSWSFSGSQLCPWCRFECPAATLCTFCHYHNTYSESESVSLLLMSDSLWPHGLQPAKLLCPWNSLGKSAAVGYHFLLQGIFLTQGSNLGLPHCREILYCLNHQETPWCPSLGFSRQEHWSGLPFPSPMHESERWN